MAIIGVLSAPAAYAQTTAQAAMALNLRAGPGPAEQIISVIPADGEVTVEACLQGSSWCEVSFEGMSGWAFSDYLTVKLEGEADPVTLYENRDRITVHTIERTDTTGESALGAGTVGMLAGAVVGGPVGAAIGGLAGASAGAASDPGEQVTTYVRTNPVEQIYLDGEVVVGAGIPETVTLQDVPDSEFSYAYVNGVPVVVDTESRQIVHILR
jgi:hypothetical protein